MAEPTLYILIRSDIPDMNPGKAVAQGAHAQANFDEAVSTQVIMLGAPYYNWKDNRAFGRTLVLHATLDQINKVTDCFDISGVTVDETYPWKNWYGETFLNLEVTAAWVFVADFDALDYEKKEMIQSLPLMP